VTRVHLANGAALAGALVLALATGFGLERGLPSAPVPVTAAKMDLRHVRLADGGRALVDGGGHPVPLRPYRRIVSASLAADRLLLELAERDRILAVSGTSATTGFEPWRFAGFPTVDGFGPLEAIIALKPELVLMNVFGDQGRVDRLRDAGIEVFNLGQPRGLPSFLTAARALGELLGHPERGAHFAARFAAQMERVAAPLGDRPRRRALYLAVYGGQILGGTRGTSYHDVLTAAGLVDVAAEGGYFDWPQYRPEQIAALNPELVIGKDGMKEAICTQPGLAGLAACRTGQVITLPGSVLEDPGMGMLDAAEQLFDRVYGRP
jgi:iron complex transport system substrate-binding protein